MAILDLDAYPIALINQELKQKMGYGFLHNIKEVLEKSAGKSIRSIQFDKAKFDKTKADAWLQNLGLTSVDFVDSEKALDYGFRKAEDFMPGDASEKMNIADGVDLILKAAKPEAIAPAPEPNPTASVVKAHKNAEGTIDGFDLEIPIIKINLDERLAGGAVYAPDVTDLQGDSASPDEIRKACHNFSINKGKMGIMHEEDATEKVTIVENYIAPVNFHLNGHYIRKGTWMLVVKIHDDALWERVKSGELTGFSMGGRAQADA